MLGNYYYITIKFFFSRHKDFMAFNSDDVLLGLLPFYHSYGLTIIGLAGLKAGTKVVILPKFQPESFLQVIQDYKVSNR